LLLAYIRTIVLYFILIAVIRLMGKRQLGQMEPSEFVVTILVANLATIPMQDGAIPLLSGIVPILTVLGAELIVSALCLRSIALRRVFCGKPVILIDNGKILQQNLRKTRISLDELTECLREKDVLDLGSVQFAILETSGKVTVFPYPSYKPASARDAGISVGRQYLPITIISDGRLLKHNLKLAGKDDRWLQKVMDAHNTTCDSTWILTVDSADHIFWCPKGDCL